MRFFLLLYAMRLLGIDFGRKRIGLAVAESGNKIAFPRVTISKSTDAVLFSNLKKMCELEKIEKIIVGKPLLLDGREDEHTKAAITFGKRVQTELHIPVDFVDERLTTVEAEHALRIAGAPVKREKMDPLAAQRILERFLVKP